MKRSTLLNQMLAYEMGVYLSTRPPEPKCACHHLESEHLDWDRSVIAACQIPGCGCTHFEFATERKPTCQSPRP